MMSRILMLIVGTLMVSFVGTTDAQAFSRGATLKIKGVSSCLYMRTQPRIRRSNVMRCLRRGKTVKVVRRSSNGYYLVRYGAKRGYMKGRYLGLRSRHGRSGSAGSRLSPPTQDDHSYAGSSSNEATNDNNLPFQASRRRSGFPRDCPNCRNFRKKQKKGVRIGLRISSKTIMQHVRDLKPLFPRSFKINPKVAVCIANVESRRYMGAAASTTTARGLFQVTRPTARDALRQRVCRKKMPYNWSTMAKSTKAQTFMFMCVAYMKSRGKKFNAVAVRRYYGSRSRRRNNSYLNKVRRAGCKGLL